MTDTADTLEERAMESARKCFHTSYMEKYGFEMQEHIRDYLTAFARQEIESALASRPSITVRAETAQEAHEQRTRDEALLRQALGALVERMDDEPWNDHADVVRALRERLGET